MWSSQGLQLRSSPSSVQGLPPGALPHGHPRSPSLLLAALTGLLCLRCCKRTRARSSPSVHCCSNPRPTHFTDAGSHLKRACRDICLLSPSFSEPGKGSSHGHHVPYFSAFLKCHSGFHRALSPYGHAPTRPSLHCPLLTVRPGHSGSGFYQSVKTPTQGLFLSFGSSVFAGKTARNSATGPICFFPLRPEWWPSKPDGVHSPGNCLHKPGSSTVVS